MIAVIIIIGLTLGSFVNVLIHRLPEKQSLIRPPSSCSACGKTIRFYDNIPLLSYFILRGKCRECDAPISWRYPVIEGLTALFIVGLYVKYGWSTQMITYSVLVVFLTAISVIDIDRGLILNRLILPGCILGIAFTLGLQVETWTSMMLGGLLGGLAVWLIAAGGKLLFRNDSLGMGDVKLLVLIGIYVGFPDVFLCLFFGIFIAGIFIIIGMALHKIRLGDTIPFGPFIALGSLAYLYWGETLLRWYLGRF
jgi:leader peptidase (prepilin peptidase)/N-methyltransferase